MLYVNTWRRVTNLYSLVINHFGWAGLTMSGGHLVNETALGESFPGLHFISQSLTPILDTKIHLLFLIENLVESIQSRLMIINGLHKNKKNIPLLLECLHQEELTQISTKFFFNPRTFLEYTFFYCAIRQENDN